jgi:ABC-type sugar transport system substrate-binding protein
MPKVIVALLNEAQEFQQLQARDARTTAAKLGLDVEVVFAEGHAVVQIQQLFAAIHAPEESRPAAIVVEAAVAEGLERVARNAVKAGMGWVLVNVRASYLEALREANPGLLVGMIGTDQREVGRIQGRQVRKLIGAKGHVLNVRGPKDSTVSLERLEGLQETLGGGFEMYGVAGDWTEASSEKVVTSWLRLKSNETLRPDVVVAQNDSMAAGARRALSALRPDWTSVPFLGCDGLPEGGEKMVAQGRLAATVSTPSNTGPALELVDRWLRTKQIPPREVLLAPRSFPAEDQIRLPGRSDARVQNGG